MISFGSGILSAALAAGVSPISPRRLCSRDNRAAFIPLKSVMASANSFEARTTACQSAAVKTPTGARETSSCHAARSSGSRLSGGVSSQLDAVLKNESHRCTDQVLRTHHALSNYKPAGEGRDLTKRLIVSSLLMLTYQRRQEHEESITG